MSNFGSSTNYLLCKFSGSMSMSDIFVDDPASIFDYSSPLSIEDGIVDNIMMTINSKLSPK